ncbi:MAG: hypothetical protein WEB37_11005 [Bacteroidota bacterium]
MMNFPDGVIAVLADQRVTLMGKGGSWKYNDLAVALIVQGENIVIEIECPQSSLTSVTLRWRQERGGDSLILNDHWERTCGDVCWHISSESEQLPWYFMEFNGRRTSGVGVKTGTNSFCYWHVGRDWLSLTMDTRSGGVGVQLGGRKLRAAEVIAVTGGLDESPFQTARRFMRMMCDHARMPVKPVYGINDWYFAYGNTSAGLILEHTRLMAPMAEGLRNRPFSVIDAGWFETSPRLPEDTSWGSRLDVPNAKFGDMSRVAERIREAGMRPGIWTRPLCASHDDPASFTLKGRDPQRPVLDSTIPENLERISNLFKVYNRWGYELVKFDFTTFDLLGKWGSEMIREGTVTSPGWRLNDNSRTNAEIVLDLYRAIREAAGDTYIIACDTFAHLSAGIFELNRIGDDTSGIDWAQTRKMGVNTLAFRGIHHGIFYAADPDCVGVTDKVPWEKNSQWMRLVARSGTPLFISAQPNAIGPDQKAVIKECFALASQGLPVGEPLDWMENAVPRRWRLGGEEVAFDWE